MHYSYSITSVRKKFLKAGFPIMDFSLYCNLVFGNIDYMNKSAYFFGQYVFGQLISLINFDLIKSAVRKHNSDHYTKKFSTSYQLISMLFSTISHCSLLQ